MAHKRICFIIASFSNGGVNRVVSNLSNEFVKRSIEVDVVALSSQYLETKELYNDKVKLKCLTSPRFFSFLPLWLFFLKNRQYDAVISSVEFVNVHTIIAYKFSWLHSKLIVSTHTDLTAEKKQNTSLILKIVYRLSSILYPLADHVCAVSQGVADSIHKELALNKMKIHVIYNPIVHLDDLILTPAVPHKWYRENIPVIIGCGRLTKAKNFQLLISTFGRLLRTHAIRLIILGDGELKNDLLRQIDKLNLNDDVYLAGKVTNPLDYFFYSRMLVVTSSWEGFGNVLVESLSVGCPVISVDCPSGPSEILEKGVWGKLVKMNDPEELYCAMIEELEQEKVSREHLQIRAKDFFIDKIADQYLRLINSSKEYHE